jgi:hypothetical protein
MAERKFTYKSRPKEDWSERANMRGGQFDSYIKPAYKLYKAKDGKNVIRVMPPTWKGARHYGYDIYVNYRIGPDNNRYLSLSKMGQGRDPIAEARLQAQREGDEALAKELSPAHHILMWVIDRLEEDEGPMLYPAPFTKVDKAFIDLARDPETGEIVEVDHPDEGCDIRFYKTGQGQTGTDYPAAKMRLLETSPLSSDEEKQEKWLEYITENPIPDCLNFYSYDHIAKVFGGGAAPKDEGDPEPAPRSRPSRTDGDEVRRPRVQAKPEPDEEAESEEHPETEEESEPTPASRRARPRVAEETADPGPKSGSIRDRIRQRHQASSKSSEED